jgi:non-ribosomal peptide synthetase-like protein
MILRGSHRPDLLRAECLPDLLAATARRQPEHPALIWDGRTVSYAELVATGETIAQALFRRQVAVGRIAGLWLPRGADLLMAQAGICLSGAAWLPFDAETPVDRIQTCLHAARAAGLVTCRAWLPRLAGLDVPVWAIEDLLEEPGEPAARPAPSPDNPAYVIYTSGSTGLPKGILISHRSICHFLRSENDVLGIHAGDRVYQGFSVAFDMSFEEIWISYLVGATLWIAPASQVGDPEQLARTMTEQQITVVHAVPTLMGLIDDPLPTVRLINLGGEACPETLVDRLTRPGRQLFNTYGPTEAAVSASIARLEPGQAVSIGMPLPNYGLAVLDDQRRLVPNGEVGELAIFGPGLAIGYLGQPELAAARFIGNPHAEHSGEARLYLTGDLARIASEGGPVYCLGRVDNQVKIRGFRVELGEIETALANQPGVATAAVILRPIEEIDQLVAFVVPAKGKDPLDIAALRQALAGSLPPYMVPAHIEVLPQLPRLASDKIDRKALLRLPLTQAVARQDGPEPRNDDEKALFAVLRKLMPDQTLRPEADFFTDLGGHSLLAARLVSQLRTNPSYSTLGVGDLYRERRLDAFAQVMTAQRTQKCQDHEQSRLPISRWRHFCCGLGQAIAVPFLVLWHISTWLAPFFTYHYFTGDEGDTVTEAAAWAVGVFVLGQLISFLVAIAGKWLVLGRVRPGRHPLWGWVYYRYWLAHQLASLAPVRMLNGTVWLNYYLRALGARIGNNVMIDSVAVQVPDLLTIDDGVDIGSAVLIENARVEAGELIIGPVHLGAGCFVDSNTVLEEGTVVGKRARLDALSALAAGRRIPDGELWAGSPARRFDRVIKPVPPRPQPGFLQRWSQALFFAVAAMAISVFFFMLLFPAFIVIDTLDVQLYNIFEQNAHPFVVFCFFFVLGLPASVLFVVMTILLAAGLRRLLLPRQVTGTWSLYGLVYCRKWLVSQIFDASLETLHGLYASVFAATWLRLMGAKVGTCTEVSTATGLVPDLLTLGKDAFVADGVTLGDEEHRGGWMILSSTTLGNRSFLGNGAYVPDGSSIPDDVLIGVQTRTPENHQMSSGQVWLGSPPVLLPAREKTEGFDESLTFRPSAGRYLARATIETLRIVMPLAFSIGAGYLIVSMVMPLAEEELWGQTAWALALAGGLYGSASFVLVVILKWLLIGRYRPTAQPMWTPFVWLSEAITNLYESIAVPNFLGFLVGTPMLPWTLRLLGADIGKRVYLDTTDMTEFDCVRIGDESELNNFCGPQTHLFEDRIMKIGNVDIGAQVTIAAASTILYHTQVGDRVRLGPLTLVAKGERLPANTNWEGSPASPERRGKEGVKGLRG